MTKIIKDKHAHHSVLVSAPGWVWHTETNSNTSDDLELLTIKLACQLYVTMAIFGSTMGFLLLFIL